MYRSVGSLRGLGQSEQEMCEDAGGVYVDGDCLLGMQIDEARQQCENAGGVYYNGDCLLGQQIQDLIGEEAARKKCNDAGGIYKNGDCILEPGPHGGGGGSTPSGGGGGGGGGGGTPSGNGKQSWWAQRSDLQKAGLIGGGAIVVLGITALAVKG